MTRKVTIVCGPPCSGKSTWVQQRAQAGDVVVDFDQIAQQFGSTASHDHSQQVREKVRTEIARLLAEIEHNPTVTAWVIRTIPDGRERHALAKRLGAEVVVIAPPVEQIAARAARDGRPAWTVPAAERWWERYTPHPGDKAPHGAPTHPARERKRMADDQPDTGTDDDAPHGEPSNGKDDTVDWKTRFEQLQKDARKWEERSKANAKQLSELEPLAKRARELEDASKSDIERATSEAQQHLARADKAENELLRLRVALRKGLTETQAKRLIGLTEDELEADADDLLASFSPKKPEVEPDPEPEPPEEPARADQRRRPQERLRPGAVPDADTEPEETDPRKLAALIPRHPTLG